MKKSIFLFFAAILCAIGVQGAVVTPTGKYFYFKTSDTWKADGARFAVCFQWKNGGGQDDSWKSCVSVPGETDIYYVTAPAEYWDIFFCRMNGGNNTNNWSNKWNQTGKLQYDGTKNYWVKSSGWNENTTYKTYAPPMSSVTLANNGTAINSGSGTEADPYIIEIGTTIKVKAEGTKAVEDPDATINYDFKQGSTSKQNGTGTTWTLDATDASTVYTINLDGYTKVNTTSSTKKAATALYFKTVADVSIPTYQVSVSINDNTMGSVIGAGEYNENATVTLKATANDGYRFVNWTVGGVEKETATTYSFTVTEAVEVVANFKEIPTETVYLVNNSDWTKVYAYGWDGTKGETPAWPGAEITANKLAEKYEGYDVYSYKVEEGSYGKVIFNNGSGKQTSTFDWTDGNYYYAVDPLGSNVFLAGDMNEWNGSADELKKETAEGTTASIKVNLTAKTYEFKLVIDGAWKANTGTMQRGGQSVHEGGWSFDKDGYDDKCKLVADIAGDYIFTWDLTEKKLTVTYPALPKHQVTATVNPAETGEVTGTGEYEQGSKATLVATPAAGYAFKNWTVGSTEKSTEATYTFTVNEPISLVANFIPEVTKEVTISYLCNSNPIPGHAATTLAVGVTTPSTITAPAITNYKFDSWTVGTGVQAVDATTNPIQITTLAEGAYTLVANYTKIELTYTVKVPEGTEKCYIAGDMNSWSFQEMTPTANANEFTITIDGATTAHKYKYTCGESWDYVEKKADGYDLADNRSYEANDVVAKWGDPLATNVFLAGEMTNPENWDINKKVFKKATADATTASVTVALTANKTYKFKLVIDGAWKGNTGTMKRGGESVHEGGWSFDKDDYDDNCQIVADIEGDYTFTWNLTTKKLTVTYPVKFVTPSVESGIFSVGEGKYVQFSTGNLQYEVGTNTWSFASKQYEVIGGEAYTGSNNTNYGMNEPGYTGKLDLFGWSSDGKFGVNPSNTDADYGYAGSDFVDWGELVNETGWYTLTKEEMNHILARTKDGKKLWALATVCGMNGLILLPDNWNTSITLDYGYVPANFNYTKNQIDDATWQTLEAAGAVFLPEGGTRVGGHGNKDQGGGPDEFDAHDDYFHVDNVGSMGYYWLNTQDTRDDYQDCASFLILPGWSDNGTPNDESDDKAHAPQVWSREKRRGNSVRLVKAIEPTYTRDNQTTGAYGTVCYKEDIVWCDGATLYEVAGKEGNKVIFDEVTTPEAGMPYIFIADQEKVNFFCGSATATEAGEHNSLQGTFTQIDPAVDNILVGNYMLVNNIIKKCGINCGLLANRAYFVATDLEGLEAPQSQMPGRRRISLNVTSENTTTGLDNITNGENTTIKVIENGQLIIIRNGEKFNAQGVRF